MSLLSCIKSALVSSGLLMMAWTGCAQAEADSDFIRTTINENEQRFQAYQADGDIDVKPSGLEAWVDDAELKWRASDFGDLDKQRLSFEVSLKNGEQIAVENDILRISQEKSGISHDEILENRLRFRYLTLIDQIDQEMRRITLSQQREIANSELNNWKSQVLSDDFRPDKLLNADLALDSLRADQMDNRAALGRYQISMSLDQTQSIAQMLDAMQDIMQSRAFEHASPAIRKARLDFTLAQKELQRANAEEKLALNSVKIQYDKQDEDFGAEVGIRVPLGNTSFSRVQKKRKTYYSQMDMDNTINEIEDQLRQKLLRLERFQDQWRSNEQLSERLNKRLARVAKIGDAQLVLDLKDQGLSVQQRQNQLHVRALRQYIDFLHTAGMLSVKPYRNWLQVGLPEIM